MPRRILVVTTADSPREKIDTAVRARAGDDAEVHVVAPASKVSLLGLLTGAIDDARLDAARRAEAAADEAPGTHVHPHVGDSDPLQAIEDALRQWGADEVIVITAPEDESTWIENGLGERAQRRFALPVTHLVAR
ncbi:MAG TPA: universal stress protein [Gaiellaceae bacterium]|jgi:hypothetical protein|nr:universal stress protein [Gaiellaceae bacterium]